MVKGIIFDLDGTLVESHLDFASIKSALGCPAEQDLLVFVANLPLQKKAQAEAYIIEQELADAQHASWIPGAEQFIDEARKRALPIAVVTRNCQQAASLKLSNNALHIELLLSREDAPAKPDPTALLQVADEWALPCADIIYVGDYLYDVEAARNAGMRSALYTAGGIPHYASLADITFDCFSRLPALLNWRGAN